MDKKKKNLIQTILDLAIKMERFHIVLVTIVSCIFYLVLKNHAKSGNLLLKNCANSGNCTMYLALISNRVKPGTVLIEIMLTGDPLYLALQCNGF